VVEAQAEVLLLEPEYQHLFFPQLKRLQSEQEEQVVLE
jgi:hypothetical protein